MNIDLAAVAGIANAAGALISTATAPAVWTLAYATAVQALTDFAEIVAFASGSQSTTAVSTVGLATGPVVIILIAVAIGVVASVQVFEHQAALNQLSDLRTTLTSVTNTPTDLKSLASDSTGIGLFKINNTLLTQTLPDVPSTRPLPTHRDGIDPLFFEEVTDSVPSAIETGMKTSGRLRPGAGGLSRRVATEPPARSARRRTASPRISAIANRRLFTSVRLHW